jgi:hypothetical protein
MMDWIVKERNKRNIEMVVHVGDMTNGDNEKEWTLVRNAYMKLDNVVSYVVCEGNHDRKHGNLMNDYFKIGDNPLNKAIFGRFREEGQLQNAYYLMEQNNMKYLFLALSQNPKDRKKVLAWGNEVLKAHPEHRVFITYHVYMSEVSRLLSKDGLPDPTDNPAYQQLVMPNQNVEFVTCGHFGSHKKGTGKGLKKYEGILEFGHDLATGHRSDKTRGVTAHQILFNAQFIKSGGDGWMLLMEFSPDNKDVKVKTFSPFLEQWRTGPEYEYTLKRD